MEYKRMIELSMSNIKNLHKCDFIDDDLIIIDELADLTIPISARKVRCLIMGVCLSGNAQYTLNAEQHRIGPNDAIIINLETILDNCRIEKGFSGIGIVISENFFKEIVKSVNELSSLFLFARNHPVFSLSDEEVKSIIGYFRAIKRKIADKEHHFMKDVVRSTITTMIYDLSNVIYRIQCNESTNTTRANEIFTKFIKLVEKNYRKERRMGWYGIQLDITPKHLSETVKSVSGRTANEWIDYYVVLDSKVLLKSTTMTIKEIAKTLNFPNQSFFGSYFKSHTGMSPGVYRKK